MPWPSDPAFWVSVAAAVAAGGSTWYGRRQAMESRRARELTERTLREQAADARSSAEASQRSASAAEESARTAQAALSLGHRAWVAIKEIQSDGPYQVVVVVHNTGSTPALDCVASIALRTDVNLEEESRAVYPGRKRVFGTLAPNATEPVAVDPLYYAGGSERVYLLGSIEYLDIFGAKLTTVSTHIYEGAERRFAPTGSGIHNFAT
jgi:hypothetical protein